MAGESKLLRLRRLRSDWPVASLDVAGVSVDGRRICIMNGRRPLIATVPLLLASDNRPHTSVASSRLRLDRPAARGGIASEAADGAAMEDCGLIQGESS